MIFRDYYRIMGLAPEATAAEIKSAYRKLARKFHPDVSKVPDAKRHFTDLGEAHGVLKDPARREIYDRLRAGGWRDGQEIGVPPPGQGFTRSQTTADHPSPGGDFSDFFHSWFGGFRSEREDPVGDQPQERGEDLHYPLEVTLEESFHGGERQFRMQIPVFDPQDGMVLRERIINARIPVGVVDGTGMRLRGQGQAGSTEALNGDLYLDITLAPHRWYRVAGRNLTIEIPLAPWEAVLGATVTVPTLGGPVTATIPADARQGQKLRLKGRGLPGDPPGDQYLVLTIVVPPSTSSEAKALYRRLAETSSFDPRAGLGA